MLDSDGNGKNAVVGGSPTILRIEWGKIEVDGLGTFRDAKLYPGGGRAWDWRETNTHHVPGIQPTDVQELIDNQCEVIVLTRGMQLVLQTCPETLKHLRDLSIETFVEETNAAVVTYNKLVAEGKAVGGLFHSTC
ncbi:MAG: Mth938-like domain-containing protein [Planctomycetota bacterium]